MPFDLEEQASGLEAWDLEALARLDRHGWLFGPGESFANYRQRLLREVEALRAMNAELAADAGLAIDAAVTVRAGDRIPAKLLTPSEEETNKLFQFKVDWAPGFFVRHGIGKLWGGCAWHDPERHWTLFLLREEFRLAPRYWIYSRRELIAHELCHVARAPFGSDWMLEEFYAYRTSASALRRYLGNCFSAKYDALIFLAPALLILAAQLVNVFVHPIPIWPAWVVFAACLGGLLGRNQWSRFHFFRARHNLRQWLHSGAQAVLFRCTWPEVKAIGRIASKRAFEEWVAERVAAEPRWEVMQYRFLTRHKSHKTKSGAGSRNETAK